MKDEKDKEKQLLEEKEGRNEGREIRGGTKLGFSLVGSGKPSSLEIYTSTSATGWIQLVPQSGGKIRVPVLRWARSRRVTNRHKHKGVLDLNVIFQSEHQTYITEVLLPTTPEGCFCAAMTSFEFLNDMK